MKRDSLERTGGAGGSARAAGLSAKAARVAFNEEGWR